MIDLEELFDHVPMASGTVTEVDKMHVVVDCDQLSVQLDKGQRVFIDDVDATQAFWTHVRQAYETVRSDARLTERKNCLDIIRSLPASTQQQWFKIELIRLIESGE